MCGYFDHEGDWQKIVDLTDTDAFSRDGWKPANGIEASLDPGEDVWGAVISKGMVKFAPKVEANVK